MHTIYIFTCNVYIYIHIFYYSTVCNIKLITSAEEKKENPGKAAKQLK